ncbi:oligosaccharide flippase family protein [Candidatus Woesebacteria bacterium]|nr:MAG: oligosaccharide flippase family protein [Candidatus Woesebacteria bacterium]
MITKIRNIILSNTFKDTAVLFMGSIIASLFTIMFTILAGRELGPELFGIISAALSFIAIMIAIGDMGLGSTLFRYVSNYLKEKKFDKAQETLNTVFAIRIISACIFIVVLTLLSPVISSFVLKSEEKMLTVFSALAIAGFLIVDFQIQVFQSQKNFGLSALLSMLIGGIRLALTLMMSSFFGLTLINTMMVYAGSYIISFIIAFFWQKTQVVFRINYKNIEKGFVNFSSWMALSRIAGAVNGRIDTILLLQVLTPYQTGIFSAARQLSFGIPLLAGSFARVLAPRYASLKSNDLKKYFMKTVWLTVLMCFGLLAGIVVSPYVIAFFGDKYSVASGLLKWLIAGSIPFMLSVPSVNLLIYAFSKPKLITLLTFIQLPFVILGIIYLTPTRGVFAPVIVGGLSNLFLFIATYVCVIYEFNKSK